MGLQSPPLCNSEKSWSGRKKKGTAESFLTSSSLLWGLDTTRIILPCAEKAVHFFLLGKLEVIESSEELQWLGTRGRHWPLFEEMCRNFKTFSDLRSFLFSSEITQFFKELWRHNSHPSRKQEPKITSLITEEATRVFTGNLRSWVFMTHIQGVLGINYCRRWITLKF